MIRSSISESRYADTIQITFQDRPRIHQLRPGHKQGDQQHHIQCQREDLKPFFLYKTAPFTQSIFPLHRLCCNVFSVLCAKSPQDYHQRQNDHAARQRDVVPAAGISERGAGAALAAVVAATLHSRRQLVRPAEGADEQRHQNGDQGLGLLDDIPALKVRAPGFLSGP